MLKALKQLIADLEYLEQDKIDFYKNKQLASILYIMTQRAHHEGILVDIDASDRYEII